MSARRRTSTLDIEGRVIVCYSERRPDVADFKKLQRLGYKYSMTLEDGFNYCFVDIPY